MLGNFSLGDYFKRGAAEFAWELSREGFSFPAQDIWITVFAGDDELGLGPDQEAIDAWLEIGVPRERIVECDRDENFWQMGPTGPCGPCSELYLDRGVEFGKPDDLPGGDNERFLEYWNLVFMEFDQNPEGVLTPLPAKNIDTGLGLNRLASILQEQAERVRDRPVRAADRARRGALRAAATDSDEPDRQGAARARRSLAGRSRSCSPTASSRRTRTAATCCGAIIRRAIRHGRGLGLDPGFLLPLCRPGDRADGRPSTPSCASSAS